VELVQLLDYRIGVCPKPLQIGAEGARTPYRPRRYASNVNLQEFVNEIEAQPSYKRNGARAPHKRLAILCGIAQAMRGDRLVQYRALESRLSALLLRFGPNAPPKPQDPIWRLRARNGHRTRIWEVTNSDRVRSDREDNPVVRELREHTSAGLSEEAAALISSDPLAAQAAAEWIIDSIVPETRREELLDAVFDELQANFAVKSGGAESQESKLIDRAKVATTRSVRDATFARRVLRAYGNACAVCEIAPKLGSEPFGLEGAHIRWANHRGPDEVTNGLCLCRMHHVALDRGAMTIDCSMRVRISKLLERNPLVDAAFHRFHARPIRLPEDRLARPNDKMLEWHHAQVFKDVLS
jgi:putative restriction endonuclease